MTTVTDGSGVEVVHGGIGTNSEEAVVIAAAAIDAEADLGKSVATIVYPRRWLVGVADRRIREGAATVRDGHCDCDHNRRTCTSP